ncbi:MAG: hypothetical protein AB7T17_09115 [Geobacter sp.]|jgi:hypothetical protein
MARITAVSFDADEIRVVTGRRTRSGFIVERSLQLTSDQLDAFLQHDRAQEYLVAVNPENAQFETITIPPVETKLEATLIKTEAARLHPELLPFSCSWRVIGDLPQEGRTVRKVACCLVPHQSIEPVLKTFTRHGKPISRLVAAPVALAALVRSVANLAEPLLCAHDAGTSKLLFLLEDGAVTFSRTISSQEPGWDLFDRQNVAMTADYCFQSLRVRPARVLVLNPASELDQDGPPPRLEALQLPESLQSGLAPEIMQQYQVPFMLAAWPLPATTNLLPDSYRSARLQQTVLQRSGQLFAAASIVLALLIIQQLFVLRTVTAAINELQRQQTGLSEVFQAHRSAVSERDQALPVLSVISGLQAAPDIPGTMVAIDSLRVPQTSINTLVARRDQESLSLQLSGTVTATSFAATQERFEALQSALQQIKGITPGPYQLDLKTQAFTIEVIRKP